MVTQAAEGMQHLIQSLLKYAQAGQGQIHIESVPLGSVVDFVELTLATMIAETHARILRGSLPIVHADLTQLEQLIQNLVSNAIQYCRPDQAPVIKISGARIEGGWQLHVADNGQGISPDACEQIFEPLKRLHGNEVPSSGLGLALCRTIVERHGGYLRAESEGNGRGATFHIFLPYTSTRTAESSKS
jgi:signal transduction histidine kinase